MNAREPKLSLMRLHTHVVHVMVKELRQRIFREMLLKWNVNNAVATALINKDVLTVLGMD